MRCYELNICSYRAGQRQFVAWLGNMCEEGGDEENVSLSVAVRLNVSQGADGAQAVNDNYRDWTGNYEPSEGM